MIGLGARVDNIDLVQKQLDADVWKRGEGLERGLMEAGIYLQGESQRIVPVRYGNLKNSARTYKTKIGNLVVVHVAYGMEYAIFVHEDLEARHKPGKAAKFLETPFREKRRELIRIIAEEVEQ